MKSELIFDTKATLGEGPAWDTKTQSLYWVDILEKRIYIGIELLVELDDYVGCLAPCKNRHLILGKHLGFADLDLASVKLTHLASLEAEPLTNRINDGKCDSKGRFLVGTMNMNEKEASGSLYSYDGKVTTCLLDGIRISNGLAWSPDHKIFYYIDTPTRKVKAFDYDLTLGQIANQRIAIQVPESLGWPDGMTSDTEGNLWIALWGGAQITRWNPNTGKLLNQISVPVLQPSSCVFGGRDLNELYVTSARVGMTTADLSKFPLSGGLFKINTNVTGMPTFEFI